MSTQPQIAPLVQPSAAAEHAAPGADANGAILHFGRATPEPWDYVPMPPVALDDDGYLVADTMPQNQRHMVRLLDYAPVLRRRYRGRGGAVGVDLSMPYVKGSPGKVLAPDLFVALGAEEREDRPSYKLWEEPTPDFVLEDLSPSDWRRDTVDKREIYQRLGVREYWMFDETGRRLRGEAGERLRELLVGYRLRRGEYKRVPANGHGRLPSKVLRLELCVRDGLLRFYDPAVREYLTPPDEWAAQAEEAQAQAEEAQAQAEEAQARAEGAQARAEEAQARAEQERTVREAAEQAAAAALARVAQLEAELRDRRESD